MQLATASTNDRDELIPLLNLYVEPTVSARVLYEFLEFNPGNYARWVQSQILKNEFAEKGIDWTPLLPKEERSERSTPTGYHYTQDYALAVDFAKKLAMKAHSVRGEEAREYFLRCEQIARAALRPTAPAVPTTLRDALLLAADLEGKRVELEAANAQAQETIALMEPKAALFDTAMDSTDLLDWSTVVRLLRLPYGRTTLIRDLKRAGVLMNDRHNMPYERHRKADPPYFQVTEEVWHDNENVPHVTVKTLVTQRGLDFIKRKLGALHSTRPARLSKTSRSQ